MHPLISFIRRKILRIPADRWDFQYGRGQWDGLAAESARFDTVISLVRERYKTPAILEIGCGEALMLRRMNETDYSAFTGVDLSEVAVERAKAFATGRAAFLKADMQTFVPDGKYDVIAFNESLYYAKNPAAVFRRYLDYLLPGGCIIVTAFENKYTAPMWPALAASWTPETSSEVNSGTHRWRIALYKK